MTIVITCGPSYEPIDQVRRITNFSTGRLGVTLANTFTDGGHRVICLKGEQATYPGECRAAELLTFTTNDDLAAKLKVLRTEKIDAIFHAAALCDFKVASVESPSGATLSSKKFPTRGDALTLKLVPTVKILPQLREWFPIAKLVGWKYELEGSQAEAIEKGFRQIEEAKTDACVVNGGAYGQGYGFCAVKKNSVSFVEHECILTLDELATQLLTWLGSK